MKVIKCYQYSNFKADWKRPVAVNKGWRLGQMNQQTRHPTNVISETGDPAVCTA